MVSRHSRVHIIYYAAFWYLFASVHAFNINNLPWSYDTVQLWANFYIQNVSNFTDYEAEFVAKQYDLVSFAKCTGKPQKDGVPTEDVFLQIASKIRKYSSANNTKILFYFAADMAVCDCYSTLKAFCNNQSMWMRDDYGNLLKCGNNPCFDHTQEAVRKYWINAAASVMKRGINIDIIVNGIFVDGADYQIDEHNHNVSIARQKQYNEGVYSLLDETRKTFAEINDDLIVIANGIHTSVNIPNADLDIFPHVDGMLGDHYMAYEEVMNAQNGKMNVTDLLFWFNVSKSIRNNVYGPNKTLLIKAWIGPETGPINHFGPSWPSTYNAKTPTTYDEVRNASIALITFPLATYLCGIYDEYVYIGYSWMWHKAHWIPCPEDPSVCSVPNSFYKEFGNKLGKPLSYGVITDTTKCNRSFENAKVYVDLNDDSSAVIEWL